MRIYLLVSYVETGDDAILGAFETEKLAQERVADILDIATFDKEFMHNNDMDIFSIKVQMS